MKKGDEMKKKTAVVILVVLLAMIGTGIFLQRYTVQASYREAGILVREGRYEEAMEKFRICGAKGMGSLSPARADKPYRRNFNKSGHMVFDSLRL